MANTLPLFPSCLWQAVIESESAGGERKKRHPRYCFQPSRCASPFPLNTSFGSSLPNSDLSIYCSCSSPPVAAFIGSEPTLLSKSQSASLVTDYIRAIDAARPSFFLLRCLHANRSDKRRGCIFPPCCHVLCSLQRIDMTNDHSSATLLVWWWFLHHILLEFIRGNVRAIQSRLMLEPCPPPSLLPSSFLPRDSREQ